MDTSIHAKAPSDVMLHHHLYADNNDRMKHFAEIQSIADDVHRPVQDIARVYEGVLEYMADHARVIDFLPVLVSKKVRELCRKEN